MLGTVLYGPRDVRFEERDTPTILKPTDAIIRMSATCVCGSDLWPYRGINPVAEPTPMGHEYCGIVEGSAFLSLPFFLLPFLLLPQLTVASSS
jgi:threonine dehydrogenase-like Zn-dependent dehydrogenase